MVNLIIAAATIYSAAIYKLLAHYGVLNILREIIPLQGIDKTISIAKAKLDKYKQTLIISVTSAMLIKSAASYTEQVVKEFQLWQTVEKELLPEIVTAIEETANTLKEIEEDNKHMPEEREEYIKRIEEIVKDLEQSVGDETVPSPSASSNESGFIVQWSDEDNTDKDIGSYGTRFKPLP